MTEVTGTDPVFRSKLKVINALLPYAVRLAQGGQQEMADQTSLVISKSTFMWHHVEPYLLTTLFGKSSPPSLNRAIILVSPYASWGHRRLYTENAVDRWAAAALATPYSEQVAQSVVDALLQIFYNDTLRPQIPIDVWSWLKRRPSLPPVCWGRYWGGDTKVVHHIRRLGDIDILKSYFLVVWSEWDTLTAWVETQASFEEDFGGIGMWCHREELVKRLDDILEQLDRGLDYVEQYDPYVHVDSIEERRRGFGGLKEVLLEVDRKAMQTLSRTPLS